MRWDELFAELEAEFSAAAHQEAEAEIVQMVHAEAATIAFADRVRGRVGEQIRVRLRNGEMRHGILDEANRAWLMIHDGRRRYLLPYSAVSYAGPLAAAAPEPRGIGARLTLGYALRKIAEAGLPVRVLTDGGTIEGRIGQVGADYCDVHTPLEVVALPWTAVVSIEH